MTNGEKIRNMSDIELAKWIRGKMKPCYGMGGMSYCTYDDDCCNCILKWLKDEVEE